MYGFQIYVKKIRSRHDSCAMMICFLLNFKSNKYTNCSQTNVRHKKWVLVYFKASLIKHFLLLIVSITLKRTNLIMVANYMSAGQCIQKKIKQFEQYVDQGRKDIMLGSSSCVCIRFCISLAKSCSHFDFIVPQEQSIVALLEKLSWFSEITLATKFRRVIDRKKCCNLRA